MSTKLTTEEFVDKATKKHNGRYDYSRSRYVSAHVPVEILCSIHGSFFQKPSAHLFGNNCRKCTGTYPDTTESFVEKAKKIHGSLYGYDNVRYEGSNVKIEIDCFVHGSFCMKPGSHISGKQGCPTCAGRKPIEEINMVFLQNAKEKHGNKYDYSKTILAKADEKVVIGCRKHGPFHQLTYKHIRGDGCPSCSVHKKGSLESFVNSARKIHGERYRYDRVNYKKSGQKVEIYCEDHGYFWLTPNHHVRGIGCGACAGKAITTQDFIKSAIAIHGTKYDYSKSVYLDSKNNIEIICPEHGSFWQTSIRHLGNKNNCRRCAMIGNGGYRKSAWTTKQKGRFARLYMIECYSEQERFCKIGITLRGLKKRFDVKGFPYTYSEIYFYESLDAGLVYDLEKSVGRAFKQHRYIPLLQFGGYTECFQFSDINSVIDFINTYTQSISPTLNAG